MSYTDDDRIWGSVNYERRITVFYDVLGWRSEIEEAGDDPQLVARLAAALRMFASQVGQAGANGGLISTFSDNVVFSKLDNPSETWWALQGAATIQLGLAIVGFFVRGGVAVGNLHHDHKIVFGPALNRAYHLESKEARYPHIIIDPSVAETLPDNLPFIDRDDDYTFIDPFKVEFFEQIHASNPVQKDTLAAFNDLQGSKISLSPVTISGHAALYEILNRLRLKLLEAPSMEAWSKNAWLFDRIAGRLKSTMTSIDFPSVFADKKST